MIGATLIKLKTLGVITLLLMADVVPIKISGIKTRYNRKEKVSYTIVNAGQRDQDISIALESETDGEWHETIWDLTQNKVLKGIKIYHLKKGERKAFLYSLKDPWLSKGNLKVRIVVSCHDALKRNVKNKMHSTPFLIAN